MPAQTSANAIGNPSPYYPFGERAAALIGVSLDSLGNIEIFARSRADILQKMEDRFTASPSAPITSPVQFTFTLADFKAGMFTTEVAGWVKAYEINRAHFLGYSLPFGSDDLIYDSTVGGDKLANRKFTCTYYPTGKVMFEDGLHSDTEIIDIRSLDNPKTNYVGRIYVVVRVTSANFEDNCVNLSFANGFACDGETNENHPAVFKAKSDFTLHKSTLLP